MLGKTEKTSCYGQHETGENTPLPLTMLTSQIHLVTNTPRH